MLKLRKNAQFSLMSLGVVVTLACAVAWLWPKSQTQAPEQLSNEWVDFGTGVAKRIGTSNVWGAYAVVSGQGIHCVLRRPGYSVPIQLPRKINVGDKIDILPFHETDCNFKNEIREMREGTMLAVKISSPLSWYLGGDSKHSKAVVEVKELSEKTVVLHVAANLELEDKQTLVINDSFVFKRSWITGELR